MATKEIVMCFPADVFNVVEAPSPFSNNVKLYTDEIFKEENVMFLDRVNAETNVLFKQVIPYNVLKYEDSYLVYRRSPKGGESRLHAKLSLGIGGHVNQYDIPGSACGKDVFVNGSIRELEEEVNLPECTFDEVGVIYDDSDAVGQVHFGIVRLAELTSKADIIDDSMDFVGWMDKDYLEDNLDKFENWSQIVISKVLT